MIKANHPQKATATFAVMKKMLTGLFVFICVTINAQTCIIIYVGNNGITAGADRKYRETATNKPSRVYFGRKIFTGNHIYWAMSGADNNDVIHSICREACGRARSLENTVKVVRQKLQATHCRNEMHALILTANQEQKEKFKENLAEIVFFKFDGRAYKAIRLGLSIPGILGGNETLHYSIDSITSAKNRYGLFILGHSDAIPANTGPREWTNPAATIRKFIIKQSKSTPADVSAESDIITVTKQGFTWVR